MTRYTYSSYPYRKPPELDGGSHPAVPVIIVGAGPVGLAAAIDLALHDIRTVVLDDNDVVSVGSRAICWCGGGPIGRWPCGLRGGSWSSSSGR